MATAFLPGPSGSSSAQLTYEDIGDECLEDYTSQNAMMWNLFYKIFPDALLHVLTPYVSGAAGSEVIQCTEQDFCTAIFILLVSEKSTDSSAESKTAAVPGLTFSILESKDASTAISIPSTESTVLTKLRSIPQDKIADYLRSHPQDLSTLLKDHPELKTDSQPGSHEHQRPKKRPLARQVTVANSASRHDDAGLVSSVVDIMKTAALLY